MPYLKIGRKVLYRKSDVVNPWVERLNESLINLGAGKRQIVQDGILEKQFQITIPEQFISREQI